MLKYNLVADFETVNNNIKDAELQKIKNLKIIRNMRHATLWYSCIQ